MSGNGQRTGRSAHQVLSPSPKKPQRSAAEHDAEAAAWSNVNTIVVRAFTLAAFPAADTLVDGYPCNTKLQATLHLLAHELVHCIINGLDMGIAERHEHATHSWLFRNICQMWRKTPLSVWYQGSATIRLNLVCGWPACVQSSPVAQANVAQARPAQPTTPPQVGPPPPDPSCRMCLVTRGRRMCRSGCAQRRCQYQTSCTVTPRQAWAG